MAGNTALDVLIAEMLGDVGKLHDEVRLLNSVLPALTGESVARLTETMDSINTATAALRAASSTHVEAAQKDASTTMDRIAKETAAMYVDVLGKEVARLTERELTVRMRAATERIHEAAYAVRSSSWVTVIAVVAGALLASVLTVGGQWLLGQVDAVQASNAFPAHIESKTGKR